MKRRIVSNTVSPVPSIITSECSNTSGTNYNEYVDCFLESQSESPQVTRPSLEQYYFTPVHNDVYQSRSVPFRFDKALGQANHYSEFQRAPARQEGSFPQCRDSPHYEYGHYHQKEMIPSAHLSPFHNVHPNVPTNYNRPMYCRPAIETPNSPSPIAFKNNKTQEKSSYAQVVESPVRSRKTSMDSFDSNISPSRNNSSDESNGCVSPLPQNLKGDPHRQAKVKTELCLHYVRGKECPFGSRCNYAHGEDELKYTTLFELKEAGLVEDITRYRSHPCVSWVATGAW